MKKIFRTLAIVAVAALGLTACENDINEQISENDKVSVKVVGTVADLTRSTFGEINTTDGKVPSTWSGNETVGFSVNGATWVDATNAVEGNNAEFDVELTAATEGYIYAASPRNTTSSYDLGGVTSVSGGVAYYLTIPAEQTPLTGSVDESTHLLFGKHAIDGSIPETVQMAFNHIAAYGKMHIKEYQGNGIKSVTITAESDDLAAKSLKYVFADGSFDKTAGSYEAYKTITIDATNVVYTEANGGDVWFTCLPGVSDKMAGNMTIVITDNNDDTYTKTLATAGKLAFIQGQVSAFTVSMKDVTAFEPTKLETPVVSATAVENVVTVTLSEAVENAEFYTITINEDEFTTEELTYVYNGAYDTEYQISVIANTTNPLFANSDVATVSVRTPQDLSDSIIFANEGIGNGVAVESAAGANFVVTFDKGSNSNATKYYISGEALRAYGGNTFTVAKTGEKSIGKIVLVYGGSDGSNAITTDVPTFDTNTWTGVANSVTFTIGGTTGNRRIAAIRVYYTDEVAVEAQPLATPEIIAEVQNLTEAFVIWDDVENAASYTVTCGEQTQTVAAGVGEATFTGLDYSTTYTISVVAHPEVGSLYWLASEAATTTVTTGADATDYSGKYLIVAQSGGKYYYMSTWKDGQTVITGGNNRTAVDSGVIEITDYNSSADFDNTVEEEYVWNVEAVEGGYTFANSDKSAWLYLGSNDNRAKMTTTENEKETFTISKEGNVYTIKATSYTRTLALNKDSNNSLFNCYASGSYVYDIVLIPFTGTILPTSSLAFDVESVTVDLADFSGNFPEPKATLTVGGEVYAGEYTITYETSDATVAEVNEDGEVTIKGGNGTTATITATVATTATYRGCTASYTITIVDGASAGPVWKKATSVTVGKEYVLVCGSKSMYLTGISTTSTKYGLGSSVTIDGDTIKSNVEDSAILTLEEGSTDGTYSFKMGDKYLTWTSGNSLNTNATKSANTSWKITFDASGNATILNGKDNTRKLQWNASSPRFACYTGSQTAVQLYEKQ